MEPTYQQMPPQYQPQNRQAQMPAVSPVPPSKKRKWGVFLLVGIFVLVSVLLVLVFSSLSKEKDNTDVPQIIEEQKEVVERIDLYPDDTDRDGISNSEEERLGTSSDDFDTDGDGISDQVEITVWNTDPLNRDTDGDGFADGFEILKGYNPNGAGNIPVQ
ncbi:hypothetical protein KKG38_03865 [Patescibacteria group bacterium]|nr:hypothetical protein [Patescibacteria group bacterium]MBU1900874.1 hypothetical protein [Patescibacteria group bacterium]